MRFGKVILVDELLGTPTDPARPAIYDRDIGMRLLYQDTGAEHYLIRYPAGLRASSIGTASPRRSSSWTAA